MDNSISSTTTDSTLQSPLAVQQQPAQDNNNNAPPKQQKETSKLFIKRGQTASDQQIHNSQQLPASVYTEESHTVSQRNNNTSQKVILSEKRAPQGLKHRVIENKPKTQTEEHISKDENGKTDDKDKTKSPELEIVKEDITPPEEPKLTVKNTIHTEIALKQRMHQLQLRKRRNLLRLQIKELAKTKAELETCRKEQEYRTAQRFAQTQEESIAKILELAHKNVELMNRTYNCTLCVVFSWTLTLTFLAALVWVIIEYQRNYS